MDGAYAGGQTRQSALDFGWIPVVPPPRTAVEPWAYDRALYRRRNQIERLFRRLQGFRRVFSRFDKLDGGAGAPTEGAMNEEAEKSSRRRRSKQERRRIDARGTATCFYSGTCSAAGSPGAGGYDGLNRPLTRSYSDSTPTTTFEYDAVAAGCNNRGRLTRAANGVSTMEFACYDALGRVKQSRQTTAGESYLFTYDYNLDDTLQSVTYPSGKTIAYGYDPAGRVQTAASGSGSYVTARQYAPHGGPAETSLGNGVIETVEYNNRLQPTQIKAGGLLTLDFGYGTGKNNGNVRSQAITPAVAEYIARRGLYARPERRLVP